MEHKFTYKILVVNAAIVLLASVFAYSRIFQIFSVRVDFC